MESSLLNLDNLTEEERILILKVIKRDEDLRWEKTQQINHLKNDIHNLRIKSILHDGDDLNKMCARCHQFFGFFFNTGDVCPRCKFKVCKSCRETHLSGTWSCIMCFKQIQLKLLGGDWMKTKGKKKDPFECGGDIVKASIKKSLSEGSLRRDDDGSPAMARASVNPRANIDKASNPQDSDKRRLHQLFESFRSNTADQDKSVTRVSCRRHRDSVSSTSSEEGEQSYNKAQLPRYTSVCDSITSSEPGLIPSRPASETESTLNSPVNSNKNNHIETVVPYNLPNGKSSKVHKIKPQSIDTVSQSSSSENARFSSTESGQNSKQSELRVAQQTNKNINLLTTNSSPKRTARLSPDHSNSHIRKGSGQSDTSSVSSARTASPATKMRLLDLASSRALERDNSDGSDLDELQSGRSRNKKHPSSFEVESRESETKLFEEEGFEGSQSESNGIKLQITNASETASSLENSEKNTHRNSKQSQLAVPTLKLSLQKDDEFDDEEDDNIDDLVASHRSMGSSRSSKGMFSLLSGSRESILSIYSDAGEINYGKIPVTGEALLGIDYNYKSEALEIYVKQCKDLAPVDIKRKRSDPYIKTYLLPDKTRSGKRKTRIKKHTLNPLFDEVLRYTISKSELENRILWIMVWHNDRFGHNDFLGEVTLPLDSFKFGDSSPKWYPLQERLEEPELSSLVPYKGDLVLSIRYTTPEQIEKEASKKAKVKRSKSGKGALHVLVKEARNLTAIRSNGTSDPFCKGYLLPDKHKSGKQKTHTIKKNCSPAWNHLFVFEDVNLKDLPERSLELTVWDHDTITSNDFLGGIRFNIGTGVHESKPVDWMDGRGEEIAIWQCMMDRPNTWIDACVILRASMGRSSPK